MAAYLVDYEKDGKNHTVTVDALNWDEAELKVSEMAEAGTLVGLLVEEGEITFDPLGSSISE